jgi:hypothetical protein
VIISEVFNHFINAIERSKSSGLFEYSLPILLYFRVYSKFMKLIKDKKVKRKQEVIKDLTEAFNDVKLHEAGKKKLKTAKQMLRRCEIEILHSRTLPILLYFRVYSFSENTGRIIYVTIP